jgi:hypothetical protein
MTNSLPEVYANEVKKVNRNSLIMKEKKGETIYINQLLSFVVYRIVQLL